MYVMVTMEIRAMSRYFSAGLEVLTQGQAFKKRPVIKDSKTLQTGIKVKVFYR